MKLFDYQIEHSNGSASGTIEAASQKEAKQKLTDQYATEYRDEEGKKQKVAVTKIKLEELKNG